MRGRVRVALAADPQLALVQLALDLGPRLLELLGLRHVRAGRCIGGGRYLVRVVVVDACLDAFLFGKTGETVGVQAVRRATVLPAVAVKLLLRLVWGLLGHHASRWVRRHLSDVRDATRPASRRRSAARPRSAARGTARLPRRVSSARGACWP